MNGLVRPRELPPSHKTTTPKMRGGESTSQTRSCSRSASVAGALGIDMQFDAWRRSCKPIERVASLLAFVQVSLQCFRRQYLLSPFYEFARPRDHAESTDESEWSEGGHKLRIGIQPTLKRCCVQAGMPLRPRMSCSAHDMVRRAAHEFHSPWNTVVPPPETLEETLDRIILYAQRLPHQPPPPSHLGTLLSLL